MAGPGCRAKLQAHVAERGRRYSGWRSQASDFSASRAQEAPKKMAAERLGFCRDCGIATDCPNRRRGIVAPCDADGQCKARATPPWRMARIPLAPRPARIDLAGGLRNLDQAEQQTDAARQHCHVAGQTGLSPGTARAASGNTPGQISCTASAPGDCSSGARYSLLGSDKWTLIDRDLRRLNAMTRAQTAPPKFDRAQHL